MLQSLHTILILTRLESSFLPVPRRQVVKGVWSLFNQIFRHFTVTAERWWVWLLEAVE